jgi:hypothetical protein
MTYSSVASMRIDKQVDKTTYMEEGITSCRVTSQWVDERKTYMPVNRNEFDCTCVNTREMVVMWNTATNT